MSLLSIMRKIVTPIDDAPELRARVRRERDSLIADHLSLVAGIAHALHRRLPPGFDLADLIGAGNLALLHAATCFRPLAHPEVPFAVFARKRVRGAMLDLVGGKKHRFEEQTRPSIFATDGGYIAEPAVEPTVVEDLDATRMATRLIDAVGSLPVVQRRVLGMYYGSRDEPNRVETARRLGMGVKAVRREYNAAIAELRRRFNPAA